MAHHNYIPCTTGGLRHIYGPSKEDATWHLAVGNFKYDLLISFITPIFINDCHLIVTYMVQKDMKEMPK
jgi:hypothetical protein